MDGPTRTLSGLAADIPPGTLVSGRWLNLAVELQPDSAFPRLLLAYVGLYAGRIGDSRFKQSLAKIQARLEAMRRRAATWSL